MPPSPNGSTFAPGLFNPSLTAVSCNYLSPTLHAGYTPTRLLPLDSPGPPGYTVTLRARLWQPLRRTVIALHTHTHAF